MSTETEVQRGVVEYAAECPNPEGAVYYGQGDRSTAERHLTAIGSHCQHGEHRLVQREIGPWLPAVSCGGG